MKPGHKLCPEDTCNWYLYRDTEQRAALERDLGHPMKPPKPCDRCGCVGEVLDVQDATAYIKARSAWAVFLRNHQDLNPRELLTAWVAYGERYSDGWVTQYAIESAWVRHLYEVTR